MPMCKLERIAAKWEEEIRTCGNKTTLKPRHLAQLKKHIDKIYALESKVRIYAEKIEDWAEKTGH